jgi:hypothetical protein
MTADQEIAMFCEELSPKRLELKHYIFPSVLRFAISVHAVSKRGETKTAGLHSQAASGTKSSSGRCA